ncbi:MAG: hypothetical protein KC777_18170 [Cyanobacteria bacterium HKST-UBA02]|nr:hypothetical protein [Cyanobacteria bacterium HKST-UBA02]
MTVSPARLLAALFLAASLTPLPGLAAAPEKTLPGYRIMASHKGAQKLDMRVAGDYGLASTGVAVGIHKPPCDRVYFVSRENKRILTWKLKDPYPLASTFTTIKPCPFYKKDGRTKVLGIDCNIAWGLNKLRQPVLRYYATDKLPVPKSMRISQSMNLALPVELGFPLEVAYARTIGGKTRWITVFKTEKISKESFPMSTFKVPTNYKPVKSLTELVLSSGGNGLGSGDIEDLFEHHFSN